MFNRNQCLLLSASSSKCCPLTCHVAFRKVFHTPENQSKHGKHCVDIISVVLTSKTSQSWYLNQISLNLGDLQRFQDHTWRTPALKRLCVKLDYVGTSLSQVVTSNRPTLFKDFTFWQGRYSSSSGQVCVSWTSLHFWNTDSPLSGEESLSCLLHRLELTLPPFKSGPSKKWDYTLWPAPLQTQKLT